MTSLYSNYKAVGFVTDGNPFAINRLGDETFMTCSIGNCFQVFRLDKLNVCLVSSSAPGPITHLYVSSHETFAAVGSVIHVYSRAKIVRAYDLGDKVISGLCGVGHILLAYDDQNNITIIDTKARREVNKTAMLNSASITAFIHPATYINKFLIGYANGQLDLWNSNRLKLVYSFTCQIAFFSSQGRTDTPAVTALEQSPACDVVGVGFDCGTILLINLKLDLVLFSFKQDGGAVTSLTFRTDAEASKFPFLASSSADGRIYVWNLGTKRNSIDVDPSMFVGDNAVDIGTGKLERKLQFEMSEAHLSRINKLHFLHGEPILISNSVDNSVKMWIFDTPDGSARLLKSRSGHAAPPLRIRYYGGVTNASAADNADAMSCEIVSAGEDSTLRLFNTAIDSQNMEMSQKVILKKKRIQQRNQRLHPCVGFDMVESREKNWGNLVSIHRNQSNAHVWKYRHRTITEMVLRQPLWKSNEMSYEPDRTTHSTAVCLSSCGNYGIVGSRGGVIYLYNLQSGLPRGAFPVDKASSVLSAKVTKIREALPANVLHVKKVIANEGAGGEVGSLKKSRQSAETQAKVSVATPEAVAPVGHTDEVTGLFVDMTNTVLVSCSLDGRVLFWDFASHEFIASIDLGCPLLRLQAHRDAGFVAVVGQDRTVRLIDVTARRVIRRFVNGHSREVSDLAFTPDGRRLLSSSLDATVRVWDIPTGRCLSWMSFDAPVLSITVSHSGEYLCLVQAGKVGIFMFIDRSLYETVHFWAEPTAPVYVADSLVRAELPDDHAIVEGFKEEDDETADKKTDFCVSVSSSQAQVEHEGVVEDITPKAPGIVTMTSVPKAYWASLFNLELIKERNKPIAPPVAPKSAPFFLPTIYRGGSTSSFPTPAEAEKLSASLTQPVASLDLAIPGSKRGLDSEVAEGDTKKSKTAAKSEDEIVAELAGLGSVWTDDGDWGDEEAEDEGDVGQPEDPAENAAQEVVVHGRTKTESRIMKKGASIAKSNLAIHLSKISDSVGIEKLLDYLKSLPPAAIDVELRTLFTNDEDSAGLQNVVQLMSWFEVVLGRGSDFELIQAYLHRTMTIYASTFLKYPTHFASTIFSLLQNQQKTSSNFNQLIQSNLCILKVLSGLPST